MSSRGKLERAKKVNDGEPKGSTAPKRVSTDRAYAVGRGRAGEKWHLEFISGYNLRWEKLRNWLKTRFKGQRLKLEDQNGRDWFEVYLPQTLTKADRDAIDKLREPDYDESRELYEPDAPLSD